MLVLVTLELAAGVAMIAAGAASYAIHDRAPQLAVFVAGQYAFVSCGGGVVHVFNKLDHEEILSDKFAADKSVRPRISSYRKFWVPGVQFRRMQWGVDTSSYWSISIASPWLFITAAGAAAAVFFRSRWRRSHQKTDPVPSARRAPLSCQTRVTGR